MPKLKVYVAGPIRIGNVAHNLARAIDAADELLEAGFTPYVAHANYIWEIAHPKSDATWMRHDLEWLLACDAVLRLPGESVGADEEVAFAAARGIPVFYGLAALKLWADSRPVLRFYFI